MNLQSFNPIRDFLTSRHFSHNEDSVDHVITRIAKRIKQHEPIRIIYGETYDSPHITIDSLKYYFCLHILTHLIEQLGGTVQSVLVIADSASILNDSVINKEQILQYAQSRIDQVNQLCQKLQIKINPVLMSDIFADVVHLYPTVKKVYRENEHLQELIKRTIPPQKLEEELRKEFQYALEEITLISAFDLKIGPPRERFYDQAATIVAHHLHRGPVLGLYLNPSYPLGMPLDFLQNNRNLRTFGLTPYKSNSYGLQENRIIFGVTPKEKMKQLITETPQPALSTDPNPLADVHSIVRLARRIRTNNFDFARPGEVDISPEELYDEFQTEILVPLYG